MELTPYGKNFSQKESQLFNFVVNHQEEVSKMTIRQLAASNHTSTTSIIRFCRKFDCDGFSEFKIKLKTTRNQSKSFDKTLSSTFKSMRYFYERMEEDSYKQQLNDIAKKLRQSEIIFVLGDQEADIAVSYALKKLSLLNKIIVPIQDNIEILQPIFSHMKQSACFLVLSNSGQDQRIENLLLACKETLIQTISITNKSLSTISSLADYSLSYYYAEGKSSDLALSQMPFLYIIELIFDYLVG
ncbi:MurR/RpiR family transcriptional regulator [Enterococcus sp. RIT-PI-f]|uniref:MurR/RpiR family transcriptional regulator n=1 Tax=Enterococcus sp. RIT-PI-f TaxID=1690244 RepID=UPI0006B90409|nr:MurR/RpiR family transcriptional regulator [Enterococcus sp. RIT-PI-f]KPG73057.1 hypothetical protein AEQ18_02335 [Enterococcus sp. RIT-PI-f]